MKKISKMAFLFSFLLLLASCGGLFGEEDSVVFGTGTFEGGIEEEKSTFSQEEDFLMEATLSEPLGETVVTMAILQVTGEDTETILEQWDVSVDPAWDYFMFDFHNVELDGPFEPGDYVLRVYSTDSHLIAEGDYTIE